MSPKSQPEIVVPTICAKSEKSTGSHISPTLVGLMCPIEDRFVSLANSRNQCSSSRPEARSRRGQQLYLVSDHTYKIHPLSVIPFPGQVIVHKPMPDLLEKRGPKSDLF